MRQDAEKSGPQWAQAHDPRISRIGWWLRKTRIDEFPQLINVLKGEMSLVGPRPERPVFVQDLRKIIPYYDLGTRYDLASQGGRRSNFAMVLQQKMPI